MAQYKLECELEIKILAPKMLKVIMLNDDFTTMEFVIELLISVFGKNPEEATFIMLKIHNEGEGVCGIYTYDIAYTKVHIARNKAKEAGFPLRILVQDA